ncbi:MAG: galactose mutarotase [Blastocatellia bacterium]|nr:galactose mutarotase [Blastocatellia bacterium]
MRAHVLLLFLMLVGGPLNSADREATVVKKEIFGRTPDGEVVELYTLTNAKGMEVKITNYGGIVVSLRVPDRQGRFDDVVLGFDRLEDYLKGHPYFGAIIGRYANRIAAGRFVLNGVSYQLTLNEGQNHLHGGRKGFDKVVWKARPVRSARGIGVRLTYLSRDGEEGYPGNLAVTVTYLLTEENELRIEYTATTDRDTIVNLTHHSYFNLAGQGRRDILDHQLQINAQYFTPIDANLIPTGEIRFVRGTPFDFTQLTPIGARIEQPDEQLRFGRGYDHNWVLDGPPGELRLAARVVEPSSGRVLEVWTTEPGLQFYSGNFLDGTIVGKEGRVYRHRYGFCLEPQHFPDSPNKPHFPSVVLRKGARYQTTTVYKFSVAP